MIVLIDSWAWIEYFKGSPKGRTVQEYAEGDAFVVISSINLAEVYGWILRFYDEKIADEKADEMKKRSFVCPVDAEIAIASAKLKCERKWSLGDSLIYATAKKEDAKVLTGDPHFKGLKETIYVE